MATPVTQEMAPKGGYGPIQWKKNIPKRGIPGYVYLLGFLPWTYYMTKLKMMECRERKYVRYPVESL